MLRDKCKFEKLIRSLWKVIKVSGGLEWKLFLLIRIVKSSNVLHIEVGPKVPLEKIINKNREARVRILRSLKCSYNIKFLFFIKKYWVIPFWEMISTRFVTAPILPTSPKYRTNFLFIFSFESRRHQVSLKAFCRGEMWTNNKNLLLKNKCQIYDYFMWWK